MDIYKLSVEMADRISARRAVANAFFLTVNTTLAAVIGLHKPEDGVGIVARCSMRYGNRCLCLLVVPAKKLPKIERSKVHGDQ